MWLTKGVQVLVLEQRNKEYHAGCSNTSAIAAAQVNFKEMVGERVTISRQLETLGSLTLGRAPYRAGHLGKAVQNLAAGAL